jgi:hypothetical protein
MKGRGTECGEGGAVNGESRGMSMAERMAVLGEGFVVHVRG